MGNTSSSASNYVISFPEVKVATYLNEAIYFIETRLDGFRNDKPKEGISEAETFTNSAGVDFFINYGSHFLDDVATRVKSRIRKIVKPNSDIQKAVSDILKGSEQIQWVGAGVAVVTYVLDQVKMVKISTKAWNECVEVLRFMCGLAKYINQQVKPLTTEERENVVVFIAKGSFFCASRMQHRSFFSSPVNGKEIKSLQSELTIKYPELSQYPDEDDKQNAFHLPVLSGLDELMSYIEKSLVEPTSTDKPAEENTSQLASYIKCGSDLLTNVLKRCKKHAFKTTSRQTRTVVIDVLKGASTIEWVGAGFSVVAYVLQKLDDASTNKEECFQFLKDMYRLATQIKRLDGQITDEKLHDVAEFIFQGSFFCVSRIKSTSLSRFFSSAVDVEEIKHLRAQLGHKYQDLTLEAVTQVVKGQTQLLNDVAEVSSKIPDLLPPSQGKRPDAVGIDEPMSKVRELLGMDDEKDVSTRAVVIYGVGGMGKSTLANAVFSSLDLKAYKYCHLIIKQDCSEDNLQELQQQILNDLFGIKIKLRDSEEGHREISRVVREKAGQPLFMFIDNALKGDDLAKILPDNPSSIPKRSRMLVTTRKLDETDILDRVDNITRSPYPIPALQQTEAKELLSKVVGDPVGTFNPTSDIDGLLRVCGGIPLVLNLVGTRLRKHRENLSAFNGTIETFKHSLGEGEAESTKKVVDVVYNSLQEDSYKEAFLDIAAFFCLGWWQEVRHIVGDDELLALEEAALIKSSNGRVELHDVVLNRGRKMSELDRIKDLESLTVILESAERLEKLKGIRLTRRSYKQKPFKLQAQHLDKMHKFLRVLILNDGAQVSGKCTRNFENLRYLNFEEGDSSPMELKKLPRLAIFEGRLRSDQFCDLPHSLRRIKVDHLESRGLDESLGKLSRLEELSISQNNIYMTKLPQNFGKLTSLLRLYLINFRELTSLPDTFGQLVSLKELDIINCPMLSKLSDDFGDLKSLKSLKINNCSSLDKLSDTFGQLSNLKELNISNCPQLSKLSDDFGQSSNLKRLNIRNCSKLSKLSDDFGDLESLQSLKIDNCSSLSSLSDDLGDLKSLQYLEIDNCSSLDKLSDTLGQLSNLEYLDISNCPKLSKLSDDFGQLTNLKKLDISNCSKFSKLSDDFGDLESLQSLKIDNCSSLEKLSDTFGQLSNFEELDISNCPKLSNLSDDFGHLKSLQNLYISDCQSLKRLSDDFGSLTSVTGIRATGCPVLEGKAVDQMIELKSLMLLEICDSPLLVDRWRKIEDGHPQFVVTARESDEIFYPNREVDIREARDEVIKLLDLEDESSKRAVVLYGAAGMGKSILATAVFASLNLRCYRSLRINFEQNCKEPDLIQLQQKILGHLFSQWCAVTSCEIDRKIQSVLLAEKNWPPLPLPLFLFINDALRGSDLAEIISEHLSRLPDGSRILITTRNLDETDVIEERGIKRYPYSVKGFSQEASKKFLSRKALGSADKVFDESLDIDGLVEICSGVPMVLYTASLMLRNVVKDVRAYERTIVPFKDALSKGEGNLSEKIANMLYKSLLENLYKDAFLEIATFFNNWDQRTVEYIVGDEAMKAIQEAALVEISERGRVIVNNNILLAAGLKLSEDDRITDQQSLQSALQDTQRLENIKGIGLLRHISNQKEFQFQADHLGRMHKCLRVLILGLGTEVTGFCNRMFENLRYLKVNNGCCSPMELKKLPRLAIFEGCVRNDDSFCDLPHSLRRLKVDALESLGLDESFGKLSRLEDLDITQDERYMTTLPQSFGQLQSLRCLKLSCFRDLTSLPDTFSQLSNLEDLNISDCTNLCSLPGNFGELSNLKRLKIINCTKLSSLPDGFGKLNSLKKLVIVYCANLAILPNSFGQLSSLKKLFIINCPSMSSLCDNFGQLESLKYLRIRGCRSLQRLSDDFGSLACVTAVQASGCPLLEGKAVDQMIQLRSLMGLDIHESQLLIDRWKEIKERHPLLVRTQSIEDNFLRSTASGALFDVENRFMNVNGVVRDWSSTFLAGEEKIALLVTCCDLCSSTNEKSCEKVEKKMAELSSNNYHIIYVGLMEQSEESIVQTLRHLSRGIKSGTPLYAWLPSPSHYKGKELFGFAACMMLKSTRRLDTFIARPHISASEQGNSQVQALKRKFPKYKDACEEDLPGEYESEDDESDRRMRDEEEVIPIDEESGFYSIYSQLHKSLVFLL